MLSALTPLICTLGALGCADQAADAGETTATTEAVSPAPAATAPAIVLTADGKTVWNDSLGKAAVTGTIKYTGTPPERAKLDTSSDAKCHMEVLDESAIVAADGGLKNVFVWVSDGLGDYEFEAPAEPAVLTQHGCTYVPHVLGVMKKQTLLIHNEDPTTHNVHSFSKKNKGFNMAQPEGSPSLEEVFKRDEGLFQIKCDMHAWMGCWVAVVETPFFAVTDDAGHYEFKDKLPAGTFEISFKHESFGTQKKTITVAEDGTQTVDVTFE